jgi:hypothetical protein
VFLINSWSSFTFRRNIILRDMKCTKNTFKVMWISWWTFYFNQIVSYLFYFTLNTTKSKMTLYICNVRIIIQVVYYVSIFRPSNIVRRSLSATLHIINHLLVVHSHPYNTWYKACWLRVVICQYFCFLCVYFCEPRV